MKHFYIKRKLKRYLSEDLFYSDFCSLHGPHRLSTVLINPVSGGPGKGFWPVAGLE